MPSSPLRTSHASSNRRRSVQALWRIIGDAVLEWRVYTHPDHAGSSREKQVIPKAFYGQACLRQPVDREREPSLTKGTQIR